MSYTYVVAVMHASPPSDVTATVPPLKVPPFSQDGICCTRTRQTSWTGFCTSAACLTCYTTWMTSSSSVPLTHLRAGNPSRLRQLCGELGVPIAEHKTDGPTTCLVFLGIEIDTVAGQLRLPGEKLKRLQYIRMPREQLAAMSGWLVAPVRTPVSSAVC